MFSQTFETRPDKRATKHIVNVVPAFIPGDGMGNAARVRVAGLLNRGYRVSVLCATAKVDAAEFPGLKLMQAGAGWEADRSSLTSEMKATVQSADLVFVEFGCFNICHELLQNLAVPLVLFYQGLTPSILMQSDMYSSCYWRAIGELRKMSPASIVIAASQFTLDEYSQIAGPFTGPSRVVPLFGNSQVVNDDASFTRSSQQPLKVLTVGQLFPHKNYEVLIDAARLLSADGFNIDVRHIGGANDLVARAYREKLVQLAKPLGHKFQLLGKVEQSVLDQNYRNADVVVIPSLHEGYSLPAREALLHGKLVIASSFGALPETLQGAAEHFHPLDPHELASKLKQVAYWTGGEWERTRKRALDAAPSHSKERYVDNCVDIIESTLATACAIKVDQPLRGSSSEPFHISTSESAAHISGKIVLARSSMDTQETSLNACVLSDRHIIRTRAIAKISWQPRDNGVECLYELSLQGAEDWTSVYLRFVNVHTSEGLREIQGIQRDRQTASVGLDEDSELRRFSASIEECYSPKCIVAADNRLLTKLKTRFANTILRLIYQVFIGPQMATMQSQLRLFSNEIRSLRAEVKSLNASNQPELEERELSMSQRVP